MSSDEKQAPPFNNNNINYGERLYVPPPLVPWVSDLQLRYPSRIGAIDFYANQRKANPPPLPAADLCKDLAMRLLLEYEDVLDMEFVARELKDMFAALDRLYFGMTKLRSAASVIRNVRKSNMDVENGCLEQQFIAVLKHSRSLPSLSEAMGLDDSNNQVSAVVSEE